ncbi:MULTISPECIES: HNH endonuclease [Luteimonas]|uniref:HNH endonuclease n=1 Tax=Luteimonas TaxID=83614 RepID=UPI000C7C1BA0|nr:MULTISPECIES: HNH endonuclease [Luteimonas]
MPTIAHALQDDQQVSVDEALRLRQQGVAAHLLCPECNGELRVHAASRPGSGSWNPAHFEHKQTDPSCSLCHISRKKNSDPFVRSYRLDAPALEQMLAGSTPVTTCSLLIHARIGQGRFRSRVLAIEARCRVTGIEEKSFLVASHIKPWFASDNRERLDGNNGLALAPHVDFLFDKGYVSFSKTGELMVSDALPAAIRERLIPPKSAVAPRALADAQETYMAYHRSKVFRWSAET